MKSALGLVVLLALVAVPALAEEGNVPQATLSSLGLGGMQVMSDTDGMQVRGLSSNAQATSLSLFSAFLFDPNTGVNFSFNGADFGRATDENAGLNAASSATVNSGASLAAFTATITFNGITWSATLGPIAVTGLASATSP